MLLYIDICNIDLDRLQPDSAVMDGIYSKGARKF